MTKEKLKTFNGKLGSYKLVETDDSSTTLYSEYFDENCHSTSGAIEETIYNYIQGCEISEKSLKSNEITIFEVGLGIGLGPRLTYEALLDSNTKTTFFSTEIDEGLVQYSVEHNDCAIFKDLKKVETNELTYFHSKIEQFDFYILVGDARVTTKTAHDLGLLKNVSAIYQDAFSPKKNPTLWTKQWFELLFKISNENVTLSTYSSHISVRKSMFAAGWKVFKREGFGEKRSMTICKTSGDMNKDILRNIKTAPDPVLID